jgi:hypothetical protein
MVYKSNFFKISIARFLAVPSNLYSAQRQGGHHHNLGDFFLILTPIKFPSQAGNWPDRI